MMWEYNRFCYENEYAYKDDDVYFDSVDYDIELSQYVMDDKEKKSVTETLFFDRMEMKVIALCKTVESFVILDMLISMCFHVMKMMGLGGHTQVKKWQT